MEETWLYHYDPETKQQSMEWRHSGSPRSAQNNSECKNALEKSSPQFIFFLGGGQESTLPIDYLPKGQTINAEYYSSLLVQLKDILKKKAAGRSQRGVHRALATQKKLAYLGLQCLDHPPYSPDLIPSDYHLFRGLKKQLKGRIRVLYVTV